MVLLFVLAVACPAASLADARPVARAVRAASPPKVDGHLADAAWRAAPWQGSFVERKPRLDSAPPVRTRFAVVFDNAALYVAVHCHDDRPDLVRGRSRSRDSTSLFRDDAISVKIDAASDGRTTLGFVLGPAGARLDYRGINERQFRVEFDAVWQGAARRTPDGWAAEFRIPFSVLGLDPRNLPKRVGLNLTRDHSRRNASYDWALLRPPFGPIAASQYGKLVGLASEGPGEPVKSGLSVAAVPYLLGGFEGERSAAGELEHSGRFNGGLDARAELGAGWRAHLTINTDFAHVDLDDQVVNLTRFGLFLPEKRDFFLGDLEVFSFGQRGEAQLLHTRRIGLRGGSAIPIAAGLKVVGRAWEGLRVGLLQVTTMSDDGGTRPLPWTSHLVGRAQLELGGGSNVGLMLTHRQSLESTADHNLVLGADGAWRGFSGRLLLEASALMTMTGAEAGQADTAAGGDGLGQGADSPAPGAAVSMSWRGLLLRPKLTYAYRHPDFRADLGFYKRVGVHVAGGSVVVEPRFERFGLERLTLEASADVVATAEGLSLLDWSAGGLAQLTWDAGFQLGFSARRLQETVLRSFTAGGSTTVDAGTYQANRFVLDGRTPSTLPVSLTTALTLGDYYGGSLTSLAASVTVRPSALLRYEVGGSHSAARFDQAARSFSTSLLNARVGLMFTTDLSLDAFAAWNSAAELVSLQARLRWTYLAGSDLFVVYQHDVNTDTGVTRFQSLLVKATFHRAWTRR